MLKQLSSEAKDSDEVTATRSKVKRNNGRSGEKAKGKSRKDIRKEARLMKKARMNVYHKNLNVPVSTAQGIYYNCMLKYWTPPV